MIFIKNLLIIPEINRIDKSLELAEKYDLGFEYNDFFSPSVYLNPDSVDNYIERYKAVLPHAPCTMHGAFFDINLFSYDSEIAEMSEKRIYQSIDIAKRLGAKAVIFHTNINPQIDSKPYLDNWHSRNRDFWGRLLTKEPDICIYLENMFDQTPDMLVTLSEELSCFRNYGVCFDYAHAAISKTSVGEWSQALSPFIRHVHINDNDLKSDLHLAVGSGKIEWKLFYKCYRRFFSKATVLIETSTFEAQRDSIDYLRYAGFFKTGRKLQP